MKIEVRHLTRIALLLALTLAVQMMGLPQPVTGTLVNLFLYLAVSLVGVLGGVLIGALTPWIALIRGILPPVLAPMIPFIIGGNVLLVIVFGLLQGNRMTGGLTKKAGDQTATLINNVKILVGVIVASVAKFLVLSAAVRFIVEVNPKIAKMMQIPQLLTALGGGAAAFILLKFMERAKIFQENKENVQS